MSDRSQVLRMLAKDFPNRQAVLGEVIRLKSLMALPKGTEYFFTDLHGEDRAFIHLLRSASGNIRRKIRDVYRTRLSETKQNELARIIYEPEAALSLHVEDLKDGRWVRSTILRLIEVARYIASKYPRKQIRDMAPERYRDILEELFFTNDGEIDRYAYYMAIVDKIFDSDGEIDFIIAICGWIQRICVNHLHIIGDIFDRGPGPHKIMEELIRFEQVDVQWGNHDVIWMGAALGNECCMACVLRNAISYNTFDALEDGYAIHLRQLDDFAQEVYGDDPCERFQLRVYDENIYDIVDKQRAAKMHKAMAIIQFKLEGQLLARHPEYEMNDRFVLNQIDFENKTYTAEGKTYPLLDSNFPTIDPKHPYRLTDRERELVNGLRASFLHSEVLQRHARFLYNNGSSYLTYNGNLLYHGCLPMTPEGEFDGLPVDGELYTGKRLMDHINYMVTQAYYGEPGSALRDRAVDFMWYLWTGPKSPMFGKSKMATFENYFVGDKELGREIYNPYFKLAEEEAICDKIFEEFGLSTEHGHIINGHMPVKIKDGESPMRAGGKLFVIDGGIAKPYQKKTGIAGYTLIYNSHHIALAEHRDYETLSNELEVYAPNVRTVDRMERRMLIADTDEGVAYRKKIEYLEALRDAYDSGIMKESYV